MYVIGTAGHVDHGKSALVMALTGMDPDRLQEEKNRGMTIDLGFAWLTLPSGREVSLVDVPGHERFIKNMLAGVGGIDLAMLVVAADESVMPQTREHVDILDLLQVKRGLVVVTKRDLVEEEMVDLVRLEVEDALAGTCLEGASIHSVSAVTGQGIPEFLQAIDAALDHTEPRRDVGRPRLAIDRAFTISGFGTVVTGTLIDGTLRVGQEVELTLSGKRTRIRGLQSHRQSIDKALPGNRVAANLSGVSPDEVRRGEVLTIPGWFRPTKAIDVRLRLLPGAPRPLPHNHPVIFHAHTMDTPAKVRLLKGDVLEPGAECWAQLVLEQPVALVRDDHFVIRSSDITLGGGVVVGLRVRRHRRNHGPTLDRLQVLAQGSPAAQLLSALEAHEPQEVASLVRQANVSEAEGLRLVTEAVAEGSVVALGRGRLTSATVLYSANGWSKLCGQAQQVLTAFHQQNPLRTGMPREELRTRLGLAGQTFAQALQQLLEASIVKDDGGALQLPGHQVVLSAQQGTRMESFVQALVAQPFSPAPPQLDQALINLLAEEGRVVKAADGVVFASTAFEQMAERVTQHLHEHGKITVAEVRDLFQTSRKYALALLEHLDELHLTRRTGDERVLL